MTEPCSKLPIGCDWFMIGLILRLYVLVSNNWVRRLIASVAVWPNARATRHTNTARKITCECIKYNFQSSDGIHVGTTRYCLLSNNLRFPKVSVVHANKTMNSFVNKYNYRSTIVSFHSIFLFFCSTLTSFFSSETLNQIFSFVHFPKK